MDIIILMIFDISLWLNENPIHSRIAKNSHVDLDELYIS